MKYLTYRFLSPEGVYKFAVGSYGDLDYLKFKAWGFQGFVGRLSTCGIQGLRDFVVDGLMSMGEKIT